MELTREQCILLINMVNASIEMSSKSGIPIGKEYLEDIDEIKKKLYEKLSETNKFMKYWKFKEGGSKSWFWQISKKKDWKLP